MSTRFTRTLQFPRTLEIDRADAGLAMRRFDAIVRSLAVIAPARRLQPVLQPDGGAVDLPDVPTRRANRLQRMLRRLRYRPMQGGKTRRQRR